MVRTEFRELRSAQALSKTGYNACFAVQVEPITGITDLVYPDIDVAICWGRGEWTDYE